MVNSRRNLEPHIYEAPSNIHIDLYENRYGIAFQIISLLEMEFSLLLDLPVELSCEILQWITDLHDILSLLEVSSEVRFLVNTCVSDIRSLGIFRQSPQDAPAFAGLTKEHQEVRLSTKGASIQSKDALFEYEITQISL